MHPTFTGQSAVDFGQSAPVQGRKYLFQGLSQTFGMAALQNYIRRRVGAGQHQPGIRLQPVEVKTQRRVFQDIAKLMFAFQQGHLARRDNRLGSQALGDQG